MRLLIDLRNTSRAKKNFEVADQIRDALTQMQIVLEDRKGETTWRRES